MDFSIIIFLSAVLSISIVTDIREQRIPNWLTLPAVVMAVAYHSIMRGWDGTLFSMIGLAMGFVSMFIPYLFGVMGAGDVKLMAAVGAALGLKGAYWAFVFTSLLGGVYALVVLLAHMEILKRLLRTFWQGVVVSISTHRMSYDPGETDESLPRLCYGIAIAAGSWLSIYWTGIRPGGFELPPML